MKNVLQNFFITLRSHPLVVMLTAWRTANSNPIEILNKG